MERQPSSKYRGVRKCKHDKWDARIMDPIRGVRLWLGTFTSEEEAHEAYQAASLRLEEEKALQCGQSCQKAAGLEDQAMTQKCKFCQEANQICRFCQKAAAAIIRAKKGKAKVGAARVSPLIRKRRTEESVSAGKLKMDMVTGANNSKSFYTSVAPVRVGFASSSSVHDHSAKPEEVLKELSEWSAQLLKELELIPDADLGISDSDSMAEDLIQLEEVPLWTENWDSVGLDDRTMTQQCKFCQEANQICRSCQKAAGAIIQANKGKDKVGATRVSPLNRKRRRIEECDRARKPKLDMVNEADNSKSFYKSVAPVRVGSASSSSVHDHRIKSEEDMLKELSELSAQLLKELELIPDADLGISDSDSMAEDLIQLEDVPLWTENWGSGDFKLLQF